MNGSARSLELAPERLDAQGSPGVQLQRAGEDPRRQCPTLTLELFADGPVEMHGIENASESDDCNQQRRPTPDGPQEA